MNERVLNFINSFSKFGESVIDCFTCGNCYWFAVILNNRFPNGHIMYDVVANHFGYEIDWQVYDITGNVTHDYNWKWWDMLQLSYDPLVLERIYRDCINK